MSKPYIHAENSAKKFGGKPEDYIEIHNFMDSSKAYIADNRHRALLHNTFGCFLVEKVFGCVATNSDGTKYSPRDVAEQHCLEDLGVIPTVQDWLSRMPIVEDSKIKEESVSGSALDAYKESKSKVLSVRAKAAEEYAKALADAFAKLPEDIVAVSWTQGTPSFNDGNPCEFSVYDFYAKTQEESDYKDDDEGTMLSLTINPSDFLLDWSKKESTEWAIVPIDRDEELLEAAFGDGYKITWSRSTGGFKTEEYYMD